MQPVRAEHPDRALAARARRLAAFSAALDRPPAAAFVEFVRGPEGVYRRFYAPVPAEFGMEGVLCWLERAAGARLPEAGEEVVLVAAASIRAAGGVVEGVGVRRTVAGVAEARRTSRMWTRANFARLYL
jgi:hypothetical protein